MSKAEYDLVLMSLCIFLPSAFAVLLLFFPRGTEEWMRWWSLLGTAATFVVSTWMLIDYLVINDAHAFGEDRRQLLLSTRAEKDKLAHAPEAVEDKSNLPSPMAGDLVAR